MTTTSPQFWFNRLAYALDKAVSAPSDGARMAYLELARHYCSMHELSDRRDAQPVARPRRDPVYSAAADHGRHDFHSLHDALMRVA
jgi:hypothetical protein